MENLDFTFSDTIAGYVKSYDQQQRSFVIETSDGRCKEIKLTDLTYAELIRNLGEAYQDATGEIDTMLVEGTYLFCYGIYYPENGSSVFEAKHLVFVGRNKDQYCFENQDWWVKQIRQLADFYLDAEFPSGEIDFKNYKTNISVTGDKKQSVRQETDTISRLVYGFASAFLMTGEERYYEAATKGTQYLRDHMRFQDKSAGICYWYHGVDRYADGREQKIFSSEFGDDYNALPCYEQIYALAGPIQTYRINGDARILEDAKGTIRLFDNHYKDHTEQGGYFSHLDPITLSPHSESLGKNQSKKNWNSVGDHAPAYLINLWLATGDPQYADFLEYTFDTISTRFPDYQHSPFVNERFHQDWSEDHSWGWQQNRAVVGHNLKIAWNLTRMNNLKAKDEYTDLAATIAEKLPKVGMDTQRGGWFDVMEREMQPGQEKHRFAWHDRKAWWQQEQAILAYQIMAGTHDNAQYNKLARESAAFYNAWFLDTDSGGVYFNVLANGLPYLLGTERQKGSHSMAGYHSFELAYLAATYSNLLINKKPFELYFKPLPNAFKDNKLRVQPDILPEGSVVLNEVWINEQPYHNFDAQSMIVNLPENYADIKVKVSLISTKVTFNVEVLDVQFEGLVRVLIQGDINHDALPELEKVMATVEQQKATGLTLVVDKLETISEEVLRFFIFNKQKLGGDFKLSVEKPSANILRLLKESELLCEITIIE